MYIQGRGSIACFFNLSIYTEVIECVNYTVEQFKKTGNG